MSRKLLHGNVYEIVYKMVISINRVKIGKLIGMVGIEYVVGMVWYNRNGLYHTST